MVENRMEVAVEVVVWVMFDEESQESNSSADDDCVMKVLLMILWVEDLIHLSLRSHVVVAEAADWAMVSSMDSLRMIMLDE